MSRPMVSTAHHFYQKIIFFLLAACTLLMLVAPAQAERLPDLINKVKPADVFPNATRFGPPEGKPMMAKVYEGDKEVGVVYITSDVVSTRGYSSKPIDTIVALDNEGTVKGAKMLEHHEPILLIGIPRSKVDAFIDGYIGMNPTKNPPQAGATPSPIVTGATVTVVVIGDSIVRSARIITAELAKQSGKAPAAAANTAVQTRPHRLPNMDKQDILSWQQLLDQGAVAKLHISIGEANKMLEQNNPAAAEKPEPGNP